MRSARATLLLALACSNDTPVRSFCESACDWAVACAGTTRGLADPAGLTAQCLNATRAADPTCAQAESGTVEEPARSIVEACTAELDDLTDELSCAGFVGTFDEITTSTLPAQCAGVSPTAADAYRAAQTAVAETGLELCERFEDTVCVEAEGCILGYGTFPKEAIEAVGGTPSEVCRERMDALTDRCVAEGWWQPAESFLEENPAREAARQCLPETIALRIEDCDALIASPVGLPGICAAALEPEDLTTIGEILVELEADYAPYL
jgi:hypothetical protein